MDSLELQILVVAVVVLDILVAGLLVVLAVLV
jgi:hypothetical protein